MRFATAAAVIVLGGILFAAWPPARNARPAPATAPAASPSATTEPLTLRMSPAPSRGVVGGRHLISTADGGLIYLFDAPEGGKPVGFADGGAPCEVIESMTPLATKLYHVKVRGRSALGHEAAMFALVRDVSSAEQEAELRAIPPTQIEGWTLYVADEVR